LFTGGRLGPCRSEGIEGVTRNIGGDVPVRAYVEKLREEAAKHRTRAGDRDTLAQRLHTALVTATGRLADPSNLTYDEAHLDEDALTAALDLSWVKRVSASRPGSREL